MWFQSLQSLRGFRKVLGFRVWGQSPPNTSLNALSSGIWGLGFRNAGL